MKAKQLIQQLQKLSPDEEIYLASDEEGNEIWAIDELVIQENEEGGYLAVIYPNSTRIEL